MGAVNRHATLVLAGLTLAVAGCDLFRPEAAEPPVTPPCQADVTANYGDPEGVLETIAEAILAKDCGNAFQAYVGAFADSVTDGVPYYASFADELVTLRGTVPVWNLPLERDFYRDFVRVSDDGYLMEWTLTEEGDDFPTPGVAIIRRRYNVWAIQNGEITASIAVGYADLTMRAVTEDRWAIVHWADKIDPTVGVDPADPGQRSIGEWRLETR